MSGAGIKGAGGFGGIGAGHFMQALQKAWSAAGIWNAIYKMCATKLCDTCVFCQATCAERHLVCTNVR